MMIVKLSPHLLSIFGTYRNERALSGKGIRTVLHTTVIGCPGFSNADSDHSPKIERCTCPVLVEIFSRAPDQAGRSRFQQPGEKGLNGIVRIDSENRIDIVGSNVESSVGRKCDGIEKGTGMSSGVRPIENLF